MVEQRHATGFWPSLYDPLRGIGTKLANLFHPASEASQGRDTYRIAMELPGVSEKDIEITANDGVITVKGEKKLEEEKKDRDWYFSERVYGAFSRSFRLPPDADVDNIEAELKDGVLVITVPKIKPKEPEVTKVRIKKG